MTRMLEAVEREVNARLRRVEWRFLLPSPRPERVLCLAGPVLETEVESIAREMQLTAEQVVRAGMDIDRATTTLDRRVDAMLAKRRWMLAHGRSQ